MIEPAQFHQLLNFPAKEWKHAASDSWKELCEALRNYEWNLSPQPFVLSRKWELASALQKTIRRGDPHLALQLIAKIAGMRPQEHAYFWKRLPVIACEDVGSGNTELTLFVVVCSQVFTPVRSKSVLLDVFGFLVERLCGVAVRSRIACTAACILEMLPIVGERIPLTHRDREILRELETKAREVDAAEFGFRAWQRKNGWRTAGLLKFIDLSLPSPITPVTGDPPPSIELYGLPSHSYDMYNRSGREVLRRLVRGLRGIGDLLCGPNAKDPIDAAGEALFFEEGGYVKGELECAELTDFLHRVFAARFGLSPREWGQLRSAMKVEIEKGTIDEMRFEDLQVRYAQGSLFCL